MISCHSLLVAVVTADMHACAEVHATRPRRQGLHNACCLLSPQGTRAINPDTALEDGIAASMCVGNLSRVLVSIANPSSHFATSDLPGHAGARDASAAQSTSFP